MGVTRIAKPQLMIDYSTLEEAKGDMEVCSHLASGYFAVLSGKVFEFRAMEAGDNKVCLNQFPHTQCSLQGFTSRPPSRISAEMSSSGGDSARVGIIGTRSLTSDGKDDRCLSHRAQLRRSRLGKLGLLSQGQHHPQVDSKGADMIGNHCMATI